MVTLSNTADHYIFAL